MNEREVATVAIRRLESQTGLRFRPVKVNPVLGTGLWPDMQIRIQDTNIEMVAEIKNRLAPAELPALIKQLKMTAGKQQALLIIDQVTEPISELLRAQQVNYMDVAGNAFINSPPFYVYIKGQSEAEGFNDAKPARQFNPVDMQVIFALLANGGLLNANYRQVAEHANVAMGVLGTIFRELKEQGYIAETGINKQREWRDRQKLIGRWVEQYPNLRAKYVLGRYCTANKHWWRSDRFKRSGALLGGGLAAAHYATCADPRLASVYLDRQQQWDFLRSLRFIKSNPVTEDLVPGISVYAKFWGKLAPQPENPYITHPLITYADLIDSGDSENRAAAQEIAQGYFATSV